MQRAKSNLWFGGTRKPWRGSCRTNGCCGSQKGPFPASTIRYANRFVVDYPDHGPGWLALGIALVELARYKEAESAIKKSIKFCPPNKWQISLAHMGHLFLEAGRYEKAVTWYRKAIASDPDDATYHIYLGAVLAKQGSFDEAKAYHRAATKCSTGCIDEAYLKLGFVLWRKSGSKRQQSAFAGRFVSTQNTVRRSKHFETWSYVRLRPKGCVAE